MAYNEYHIGEMHFLVFSHPFQYILDLFLWLRGDIVLDFWTVAFFLQHFATSRQR